MAVEEIALLNWMSRNRVCIVTHTFLPHVGGIERVVYEQSKRLMRRGFKPIVITSRMNTGKNYVIDGISVRCYESLNFGFGLGIPYTVPGLGSIGTFWEAVQFSDLIHIHGHPYLSSFIAAKIAKRWGKPVILTQHNTFIKYESRFWDQIERLNDATVGKQVIKNSDRIIAVSNATRNYVLSLGAASAKTSVLHNGVDLYRFRLITGLREKMRKKIEVPQKANVVLSVRRLVYKNGIDTLLQSAEAAIRKNKDLFFLVVGTGPDFSAVRTRIGQLGISDRFKLAGFVPDVDLNAYYNAADLFVLPSKSGEGLPLVGLEAMACGLPVIATDVGGISEVMVKGGGRLVPPDAPTEMTKAILEFSQMELSPLRKELRKTAEDKFSWDRNVDRLANIYEELI